MKLAEIVPWGRSFDEYSRMFGLSEADLSGSILGCGDGPASFNAEGSAKGIVITSCVPIFAYTTQKSERSEKGTQCAGIKPVWNRECKYLTKKV